MDIKFVQNGDYFIKMPKINDALINPKRRIPLGLLEDCLNPVVHFLLETGFDVKILLQTS